VKSEGLRKVFCSGLELKQTKGEHSHPQTVIPTTYFTLGSFKAGKGEMKEGDGEVNVTEMLHTHV
jgi:hypothetical protein